MDKDKHPLVSIIIPVYNVEKYINECLDSVVNQSYRNMEIILVDDGSTDSSGALCDKWGIRDSRVKVIHKGNGGLSDARNVGIKNSNGKYVYFLDSDDFIATDAIEELLNVAESNQLDIVMADLVPFIDKPRKKLLAEKVIEISSNIEMMRKMFLNEGITHCACGKLFLASLWESISFPKGSVYEDYATIYLIVGESKKIGLIKNIDTYFYRMRLDSIMHNSFSDRDLVIFQIAQNVTKYVEEYYPQIKEYAEYMELVTNLKFMKKILDVSFNAYLGEQRKVYQCVKKYKDLLKMPWAKKSDKIKVRLLLVNKYIFYLIYSFAERLEYYRLKHRLRVI